MHVLLVCAQRVIHTGIHTDTNLLLLTLKVHAIETIVAHDDALTFEIYYSIPIHIPSLGMLSRGAVACVVVACVAAFIIIVVCVAACIVTLERRR